MFSFSITEKSSIRQGEASCASFPKSAQERERSALAVLQLQATAAASASAPLAAERVACVPKEPKESLLELWKELFSPVAEKRKLPPLVLRIVIDYLSSDEKALLFYTPPPYFVPTTLLPDFIDLSSREILRYYLAPEFRNSEDHLTSACAVAKRVYQSCVRATKGPLMFGSAFPMNPEVLAYGMRLAPGKAVLEIGGASGENAVLMAFAGAKQVYLNDIEPLEIQSFEKLRGLLPGNVRERLTSLEGDCFDLLKKRPSLAQTIDLVICCNLLHFFNDDQQASFFQNLHQILKPGGQALFTVNSHFACSAPSDRDLFKSHPSATCFEVIECFVFDDAKGPLNNTILYRTVSLCSEESITSLSYRYFYLYKRGVDTGGKWKVDNENFRQLDSVVQRSIDQACKKKMSDIKHIRNGRVRVDTDCRRVYTEQNFAALFKGHGFDVGATFIIAPTGHLLPSSDDLYGKGRFVGAIVRKK